MQPWATPDSTLETPLEGKDLPKILPKQWALAQLNTCATQEKPKKHVLRCDRLWSEYIRISLGPYFLSNLPFVTQGCNLHSPRKQKACTCYDKISWLALMWGHLNQVTFRESMWSVETCACMQVYAWKIIIHGSIYILIYLDVFTDVDVHRFLGRNVMEVVGSLWKSSTTELSGTWSTPSGHTCRKVKDLARIWLL